MNRLVYSGKGSELFLIQVKNFFLRLVTFGMYSFKAKVNVRKYMWSNMSYEGEQFSFAGQAMDQVRGLGWVIAMGIALLIGGAMAWMVHPVLAFPFAYCGIALLVIRMKFGGFRYKVRNTTYRKIRGNVAPETFNLYLKQAVKGAFLTMLTLGIYRSWNTIALMKIKWNNTTWGRQPFSFTGDGQEFFWLNFKGVALSIVTFGLYTPWYLSARYRYVANHLHFMGQPFKFEMTGSQLFGTMFVMFFGAVLSLGIATPWLMTMVIREISSTFSYSGTIDFARIEDDLRASKKAGGDSAGDALDFDQDFDFAM
jgi:uncharacterized membrane protein YjgN (DUF898 family)